MKNPHLPIPEFFDPQKVGTVWRIPYEERAQQARDWALQQGVQPASADPAARQVEKRLKIFGRSRTSPFPLPRAKWSGSLAGTARASPRSCHVTAWLSEYYSGFHVFQYLTLRAILAALTALAISLLVGPRMIRWLAEY